jgi:ferrochelatase
MCPGFTSDCLETLEEIDQEARAAFLAAGGKQFGYIPCLNDQHEWIVALAGVALEHMQGWDTAALAPDAAAAEAAAREQQRQRALAAGAPV